MSKSLALGREGLVDGVQALERGFELGMRTARQSSCKDLRGARIRQPGRRAHDGFVKARSYDLAVPRNLHVADEAQPVDVGVQRAEAVRQLLGQHRHDPIREVHRRAAPARLSIERRIGANVMAHVCYRDDQPPAVAVALAKDSVIEIARVRAVDRHQRD
jgi:hypothetical protein